MLENNEKSLTKVVVGVDGSKTSIAALKYAKMLKERYQSGIEVVFAWQVTFPAAE